MIRQIIDRAACLDSLLEEGDFLEAFCAGCSAIPKEPYEECPAYNNPGDDRCIRHGAWENITEILKVAQSDIARTIKHAGGWE